LGRGKVKKEGTAPLRSLRVERERKRILSSSYLGKKKAAVLSLVGEKKSRTKINFPRSRPLSTFFGGGWEKRLGIKEIVEGIGRGRKEALPYKS